MRLVSAPALAALAVLGGFLSFAGHGAEAGAPVAVDAKPAAKLDCLKAGETREEVRNRHFLEPFVVLKAAAREAKAEALSAKLCRLGDDWVYSIAMLHKDGRYFHLLMDAATGKILPGHGHDSPKT